MSILNININDVDLAETFPEYVDYDSELKDKYGEVNTPYRFIMNKMFSMFQQIHFKNKNLKLFKYLRFPSKTTMSPFFIFLYNSKSLNQNKILKTVLILKNEISNFISFIAVFG